MDGPALGDKSDDGRGKNVNFDQHILRPQKLVLVLVHDSNVHSGRCSNLPRERL
jgi:hypothetical protein